MLFSELYKLFNQKGSAVLQWAFELNSAPEMAEIWDLKGRMWSEVIFMHNPWI
jgi:hypothetical protein